MFGLGDNFYTRFAFGNLPLHNVCLVTPWPQVYWDLGCKFGKPKRIGLRTQEDNLKQKFDWVDYGHIDIQPVYDSTKQQNVIAQLEAFIRKYPGTKLKQSFPLKQEWQKVSAINKPICLIRPNTLRKEWMCPARNPKNSYLQIFIDTYKKYFYFISIANLKHNEEEYEEPLKNTDLELLNEPIESVFNLFNLAHLMVCSQSFWWPLSLALKKHTIILYGSHLPHEKFTDTRFDTSNVTVIQPEPFDLQPVTSFKAKKEIPFAVLMSNFEERVRKCLEFTKV